MNEMKTLKDLELNYKDSISVDVFANVGAVDKYVGFGNYNIVIIDEVLK